MFFRVKWLQPAMKGTSSVRRVRLGSFHARIVPPMCFATSGCSCVRSSMRFLKLWLQIALEWLHECLLSFGVATSRARSSSYRCSRFATGCCEMYAKRIVVAASRLLGAAAACVILLSFAAEDRKSYWNGCIKAAKVNCQQIFSILALIIFLLKFLLKSASKSSFCRFGVEIRFWSCNFRHRCG